MQKKILVIDDAAEVRDLIKAILEANDYQVDTAINGREALEKIQRERPALIVADVLMPEMDGFIFLKELKKEEHLKDIPVVILTARSKMSDSFYALGVNGFLVKPINADELISTVNQILSSVRGFQNVPVSSKEEAISQQGLQDSSNVMQEFFQVEATNAAVATKVLIFGETDQVLEEMTTYFHRHNLVVEITKAEKEIITKIANLKPRLIFLQAKLGTDIPLDELVFSISTMIKERAQNLNLDVYNPHIILYKVEEEMTGVSSMAEDMVDTENLIDRCRNNGNAYYIGLYSAISFGSKIAGFLND